MKSPLNLLLAAAVLGLSAGALAQAPTPLLARSAEQCLAVLRSGGTLKERMDACRQLAILGGPEAVPVLAGLLDDESLSHMARYALEPNPSPEVDQVLLAALNRLEGRLQAGVIGSLGVRRCEAAVEPLIRLLDHRQAEVAQAAARALGKIGIPAAGRALLAATEYAPTENVVSLCEGLGRCAESLVRRGEREAALAIYDHYEDEWLPHQVRTAALRGAILTRGADGVALLRQMLHRPDYILFSAAVSAALSSREPGLTQALVGELSGLNADRQVVVIQALGRRQDPAANPRLFAVAQTGPKPVRIAALGAIAALGSPTAVPVLEGLLGDPDRDVREAARESYASLRGAAVDAAVMDMLKDLDPGTQLLAIELIQRRRMTNSLSALLKLAGEGADRVRPAAIRAVAELGGAVQIPALLDLLMQAKATVDREAAEEAVRQVYSRSDAAAAQVGALVDRLARGTPPQRSAILRLLGAVGGGAALGAVRSSLKDSDPEVRGAALRVLADWKTADAAPALLALVGNPGSPTERVLALRGYLRLAAQAEMSPEDRLAMCDEAAQAIERDEEKRLLLGALGAVARADAVARIVPHLANEAIRNEAAAALLSVTDLLLKGNPGAAALNTLKDPLRQVAAGDNANLAERARNLLRQVEEKTK
ncbi:MAG: HEAT repeat domain-containing protein [Verrucomicrobiales bacterium]|nr:HEAT repeat domain-containing protein [Verrucomicrobiales bacterium]